MWQPGWGTGASVLGDSSLFLPSSPALAPSLSVSLSSSQLPSASLQPLLLCDPASRLGDDGSDSDSDDSKESIFSGLEDSGSDSSEDTDQDVDEDEDEDGAGTDRTAAAVAQVSEWVRSPGRSWCFSMFSEPQGCVLASPLHQGVLPDVSHVTLPTWLWSLLTGPLASLTPTPLALPWKTMKTMNRAIYSSKGVGLASDQPDFNPGNLSGPSSPPGVISEHSQEKVLSRYSCGRKDIELCARQTVFPLYQSSLDT